MKKLICLTFAMCLLLSGCVYQIPELKEAIASAKKPQPVSYEQASKIADDYDKKIKKIIKDLSLSIKYNNHELYSASDSSEEYEIKLFFESIDGDNMVVYVYPYVGLGNQLYFDTEKNSDALFTTSEVASINELTKCLVSLSTNNVDEIYNELISIQDTKKVCSFITKKKMRYEMVFSNDVTFYETIDDYYSCYAWINIIPTKLKNYQFNNYVKDLKEQSVDSTFEDILNSSQGDYYDETIYHLKGNLSNVSNEEVKGYWDALYIDENGKDYCASIDYNDIYKKDFTLYTDFYGTISADTETFYINYME